MASRSHFRITPRRVLVAAMTVTIVLLVVHTITKVLLYETGTYGIRWLSLGQEQAIGTWVAAALLALAALAFLVIGLQTEAGGQQLQWHWFGLAAIFLVLSIDEVAELHEWLGDKELLGDTDGILSYQWVVFGALAVLVAAALYLRFVLSLDRRSRVLFVAAAIFFVGGALVIEAFNGELQERSEAKEAADPGFDDGASELRYDLQTGVEEFCELLGAGLFLAAAVNLAAAREVTVSLQFAHD